MFEGVDVVVTEVEVAQLVELGQSLDASDAVPLERQLLQLQTAV